MREAHDHLTTADKLCADGKKDRVRDRVHYFYAWWFLKLKKPNDARRAAKNAYELAANSKDLVIMAHALMMQAMALVESSSPALAIQRAEEALEAAKGTENRRVQARGRIVLALLRLQPGLRDRNRAQLLQNEAARLLRPGDQDYLRDEWQQLEQALTAPMDNAQLVIPLTAFLLKATHEADDVGAHPGGLEATLQQIEALVVSEIADQHRSKELVANVLGINRTRVRNAESTPITRDARAWLKRTRPQ